MDGGTLYFLVFFLSFCFPRKWFQVLSTIFLLEYSVFCGDDYIRYWLRWKTQFRYKLFFIKLVRFSNRTCGSFKTKSKGFGPSWTTLYAQCTHVQLSVLYCTTYWRQPGLRRGFVDTCEQICEEICEWMNEWQIHSGVYRLAPASKKV